MDETAHILLLLKCLVIILGVSVQSQAKGSRKTQSYFCKISKHGGSSLHPKDIISNHTVHFQIECSLRCLQTSTCVGFNFRVKSNKYVVNCQLTNKTHDRKSGESEETGEWVFYQDVQATVSISLVSESKLKPGQSCKDILSANKSAVSATYWIKLKSSELFQVYCDMETHGGGWTLVYSYTFTNYSSYASASNAVTPRPNWPAVDANVPISTTPPLNKSSLGAVDWVIWKKIGQEFMVKSTINDWLVCQPVVGSIVAEKDGSISCQNVKNVAKACSGVVPYTTKWRKGGVQPLASGIYYTFEGDTRVYRPTHDPCGQGIFNHKTGVGNPGGQIYLR